MIDKKVIILNSPFYTSSLSELEVKTAEPPPYTVIEKIPKKRGRKPGKGKMYFTEETQNYIVEYINETDSSKRNYIYNTHIKYAFEKLAENIINTFSFSYIPETYKDIQTSVVSHMLLNIHKFNPQLGKAFSYFSIMAKNFLIIENNEKYEDLKITYPIYTSTDGESTEIDIIDESYDNSFKLQETREFIKLMVEYWENNISTIFKKKRDMEIAYAIVELFRNVSALEFFNKKALYVLIRELTSHETQYITKVINKMQSHYAKVRLAYYKEGKIDYDIPFFNKK